MYDGVFLAIHGVVVKMMAVGLSLCYNTQQ